MATKDGSAEFIVKSIKDFVDEDNASKLGLPVGFETFTTNPNLQAGWLPLLGGEYSRAAYPDLWAWVQTQDGYLLEESAWQEKATANGGNVPFYSKGDGSTTFRVPALKCWVRGANSIDEVGGYLAAGLPNIEGKEASGRNAEMGMDGAFYSKTNNDGTIIMTYYNTTTSTSYQRQCFDASLSNPIYGNSDTVQPPSIIGLWVVKAYGTVTNVGSTDVSNIGAGLTQAETRINALENHGAGATVVKTYRNGTEWYRIWSDGWLEQGGVAQTVSGTSGSEPTTVTFLKAFSSTSYTLAYSFDSTGKNVSRSDATLSYFDKTSTSVTFVLYDGQANVCNVDWYACGQGA